MTSLHNKKFKSCETCFSDIDVSKKHNLNQHQKNCLSLLFPCHICNVKFYKYDRFVNHYRKHPEEGKKLNLEDVKKIYEKSLKSRINCQFCEKNYSSKITLRAHLKKSKTCGKKLPVSEKKTNENAELPVSATEKNLENAELSVSASEKSLENIFKPVEKTPWKCAYCKDCFSTPLTLVAHTPNCQFNGLTNSSHNSETVSHSESDSMESNQMDGMTRPPKSLCLI